MTIMQRLGLVLWILSVTTGRIHVVSSSSTVPFPAGQIPPTRSRRFFFSPQAQAQAQQPPLALCYRNGSRRRRLLWGTVLNTRGGAGADGTDSDDGVTIEDVTKNSLKEDNNNNATDNRSSSPPPPPPPSEGASSSLKKEEILEAQPSQPSQPSQPKAPVEQLPPAIVETTTTTILDQSEFSSVSPNNNAAKDEKSDVSTTRERKDKEDMEDDENVSNDEPVLVVDPGVDAGTLLEKEEETSTTRLSLDEVRDQAASLRLEGKELHDAGDFVEAADCFGSAADLILLVNDDEEEKDSSSSSTDDQYELAEHFATLRLHEALCRLKAKDYEAAADACTQVLEGSGGGSSSSSSSSDDDGINQGGTDIHLSSAVRARALFRRAKARMEMDMMDEALQDARVAAFLGDRKAVALYGQLMRENSSSSSSSSSMFSEPRSPSDDGGGTSSSMAASASLLESLLDKSAAGTNGAGNGAPPPPFSPFGDLMGANSAAATSGMGGASNSGNDFNPLSLLGALPAANGADGGGPLGGGLAKSVISSLSKRLDDESTHESICNFLQQASGAQLQQYASLAGVQLPDSQANKIASFAKGITPRGLKRTVKTSRRLIYAIQLMRKTMAVLNKYKMLIFVIVLLTWIKSAILRPIPINKRLARKAARQAAKAAAATAATAAI